jgi:hypothetical protein
MSPTSSRWPAIPLALLAALLAPGPATTARAEPPTAPVYSATFNDSVTGTRAFTAKDGKRYWTIEPGADSYQHDYYERPTVKPYKLVDGKFATDEYYEYLDIVNARVGFDSQYIYAAIKLFGPNKSTSDGTNTRVGLVARYGFRFSTNADGRNGFLVVADQPEQKGAGNAAFRQKGVAAYRDSDGDVGGRGLINGKPPSGRSVTRTDNPAESDGLNGYDVTVLTDGKTPAGADAAWVRISPNDPTVVEFAIDYRALGIASQDNLASYFFWEFEAVQGGPKDPKDYRWNDRLTAVEAGSPNPGADGKSEFGTAGCDKIYELDTTYGVLITPRYCNRSWDDFVTGTNSFVASDGKRYWTVDPGADSYQNDYYERPTGSQYRMIDGRFATDRYYEYVDIVSAQAGRDSRYLYVAIKLFGLNEVDSKGTTTRRGLAARYGFRVGSDPDGRRSILVVANDVEKNGPSPTTFHQAGTFVYRDEDGDVGGRGAINGRPPSGRPVTRTDNPAEGDGLNGYERTVVTDGRGGDGAAVVWVRVSPTDPTVVEFVVDYRAVGMTADFCQTLYWDFEAVQGGPKNPREYRWNDAYTARDAGSPNPGTDGLSEFGTPGLGSIYALDTLYAISTGLCCVGAVAPAGEVGISYVVPLYQPLGFMGWGGLGAGGFPGFGGLGGFGAFTPVSGIGGGGGSGGGTGTTPTPTGTSTTSVPTGTTTTATTPTATTTPTGTTTTPTTTTPTTTTMTCTTCTTTPTGTTTTTTTMVPAPSSLLLSAIGLVVLLCVAAFGWRRKRAAV